MEERWGAGAGGGKSGGVQHVLHTNFTLLQDVLHTNFTLLQDVLHTNFTLLQGCSKVERRRETMSWSTMSWSSKTSSPLSRRPSTAKARHSPTE